MGQKFFCDRCLKHMTTDEAPHFQLVMGIREVQYELCGDCFTHISEFLNNKKVLEG